jgi:hypothetical protein
LASEVLALRPVPLTVLLELFPVTTPIEFTWLLRDLGRVGELRSELASAPSTPWFECARAIVNGEFADVVEIVSRLELPAVEAYTRLRTAEALAEGGDLTQVREALAPALAFFEKVGATRYLAQAEALLAAST